MRWRQIDNKNRPQPKQGNYSDWKDLVADACHCRCVYCGIHESRYGGIDNFHVDHYKPKSIKRFAHLRNAIRNLYLSCAICNRFKSDDWPNNPRADHSVSAYPDPGECAYSSLFKLNSGTYKVAGRFPAAIYMVERLGLNRMQLLVDRRTDAVLSRWEKTSVMIQQLETDLEDMKDVGLHNLLLKLIKSQREITTELKAMFDARPYLPGDQRK